MDRRLAPGQCRKAPGIIGQHRDGAPGHRVIDKAAAIDARACQRREEKAGLHVARIRGEAADHGIAGRGEGEWALCAVHEIS
jgi:hypothetical protein